MKKRSILLVTLLATFLPLLLMTRAPATQAENARPVVVGSIKFGDVPNDNYPNYIDIEGQYAYVTLAGAGSGHGGIDRIVVLDISDPSSLTLVGQSTDNGLYYPTDIDVVDNYAHVTSWLDGGLAILDVSNPANPFLVGKVVNGTTLAGAQAVKVVGNYAYATSYRGNSLVVVNVENKTAPVIVGWVTDATLAHATSVCVQDNYGYVTCTATANKLTIVDISNPSAPSIAGSLYDDVKLGWAEGLYVRNNYAYVCGFGGYFAVVNVENKNNPFIAG